MKSKIQALIAKTHNIAVSEDDPVWIVVSIYELIVNEYKQKLADYDAGFTKKMEEKLKPHVNRMTLTIAFLAGVVAGMTIQLFFK